MKYLAPLVVLGFLVTDADAAIRTGGTPGDEQTSIGYNFSTGELWVDTPASKNLTSINITSAGSNFIGDKPAVLDGPFDKFAPDNIFKATFGGSFGDISFGNVLPTGLGEADIAADLSVVGSLDGGGDLGQVDLCNLTCMPPTRPLHAGDADQDYKFDQLDLVQVQISAKYLSGQDATWGEGDWNGAPGGEPGDPPPGDGIFDQLDIINALAPGHYLTGPYAALPRGGTLGDEQTSLVYDAGTGELKVDSPASKDLTSINITSAEGRFIGDKPAVLDGAFDNFDSHNIFKATFGGSFGDISLGNVLPPGLSVFNWAADITVVGSLAGGGDLGTVDDATLPEPSSAILLALGTCISIGWSRRRRR